MCMDMHTIEMMEGCVHDMLNYNVCSFMIHITVFVCLQLHTFMQYSTLCSTLRFNAVFWGRLPLLYMCHHRCDSAYPHRLVPNIGPVATYAHIALPFVEGRDIASP
jgi:hypothetical protein